VKQQTKTTEIANHTNQYQPDTDSGAPSSISQATIASPHTINTQEQDAPRGSSKWQVR